MRPVIVVVEDDAPVRDSLLRDLRPFAPVASIEVTETAEEALDVIADLGRDEPLAVVLADHRLPGRTGVDLLVGLRSDPSTADARRVLVTGQADHADTIRAVNEADLDHYVAKPWDPAELVAVVRRLLSEWVADHVGDVRPYLGHLDAALLLARERHRGGPD